MKSILPLLAVSLLLALPAARAGSVLQPNDVLAICGDSITEQKIYSVDIEDYLLMCQPVDGLRVVQFGWGGEQASGFQARIKSDVLPFKPTVATTCYGMNDGHYTEMSQATGDVYRQNMQSAITQLKAGGVRAIVVGSPGCVDSNSFKRPQVTPEVYNQTLDALRGIAQDVAQKDGLNFADVHTPMMKVMAQAKAAYGDAYPFVDGDGVHPGPNGHLVMAYAFLKGLGCDGAIGTITVDLGANQATGSPGQEIVSMANGMVTLKSTRYPFCFQGDPTKPGQDTVSVLKFFPFNDDLNRYVLVVKGLKTPKASVTWGKQTKEFAAADLANGINLAAEFLDNPFQAQFKKVTAAVQAQQINETILVKTYLHNLPFFSTLAPGMADVFPKATDLAMAHDLQLFNAAQALVVPVVHTIKIEPGS